MTGDENIRIHHTLKNSVDRLEKLDQLDSWTDDQKEEAVAIIHDIIYAAEREKIYYRMYRKLKLFNDDLLNI